jgi:hypothetical protein
MIFRGQAMNDRGFGEIAANYLTHDINLRQYIIQYKGDAEMNAQEQKK